LTKKPCSISAATCGALDDDIEDAAEAAAVAAARRGGEAEQHRVRVRRDDLPVRLGGAVVPLVDDKQVRDRQRHLVGPHGARPERLDARDLHWLARVRHQAGLDDAVLDAAREQLVRGLLDDLAGVREHEDTLPGDHGLADHLAGDERTGAGRCHQHHPPLPDGDAALAFGDHVVLVRAQLAHGALPFPPAVPLRAFRTVGLS
jgi:hypothetical protein